MSRVFFVLNGLLNGEEGVYAVPAGGGDAPRLADGWYFHRDHNDTDGHGPFESDEAAKRMMNAFDRMPKYDMTGVAVIMTDGRMRIMDATDRHGFQGATEFARIWEDEGAEQTVVLDFVEGLGVRMEVHTGDGFTYYFDFDKQEWEIL